MKQARANEKKPDIPIDTESELDRIESGNERIAATNGKARIRETTTKTKVYVENAPGKAADPKPQAETNGGGLIEENSYGVDHVLDSIDELLGGEAGMQLHCYLVKDANGRPLTDGKMRLGSIPYYRDSFDDDVHRLAYMGGTVCIDVRFPEGKLYMRNILRSYAPMKTPETAAQQSNAVTVQDLLRQQDESRARVLSEMKMYKEIFNGGSDGGMMNTIKMLKDLGLVGQQPQNNILETVQVIMALRESFPESGRQTNLYDIASDFINANPGLGTDAVNFVKSAMAARGPMIPNAARRPHADITIEPEKPASIPAQATEKKTEAPPPEDPAADAGGAVEDQPAESDQAEATAAWLQVVQFVLADMIENSPVDKAAGAIVKFKQEFPAYISFAEMQLINRDPAAIISEAITWANHLGQPEIAKSISESKTANAWLFRLKDKIPEIERLQKN